MAMTIKVVVTRIIVGFFMLMLSSYTTSVNGELVCTSTLECEQKLRFGSKCLNGRCSNPFIKGCLNTIIEEQEAEDAITLLKDKIQERFGLSQSSHIRVCNSDDYRRRAAAAAAAAADNPSSSSTSTRKLEYAVAAVDVPTWVNTDFNNNNNNNPSHDDEDGIESTRNYEYFNDTVINGNDNDYDNPELYADDTADELDEALDDDIDDDDFCIPNYLEYPEIRIHDCKFP
jgi:hypothetical protein